MATKEDLFAYNDGSADVFGDPAAIHRGLMLASEKEDVGVLHGKALAKDKSKDPAEQLACAQAERQLIAIIREVFQMAPFAKDGSGASDTDCLVVWVQWLRFMKASEEEAKSQT